MVAVGTDPPIPVEQAISSGVLELEIPPLEVRDIVKPDLLKRLPKNFARKTVPEARTSLDSARRRANNATRAALDELDGILKQVRSDVGASNRLHIRNKSNQPIRFSGTEQAAIADHTNVAHWAGSQWAITERDAAKQEELQQQVWADADALATLPYPSVISLQEHDPNFANVTFLDYDHRRFGLVHASFGDMTQPVGARTFASG